MELPTRFDLTPNGIIVDRAEIGCNGYTENIEFELNINFLLGDSIRLNYYGEDGSFLSVDDFIKLIKLKNK